MLQGEYLVFVAVLLHLTVSSGRHSVFHACVWSVLLAENWNLGRLKGKILIYSCTCMPHIHVESILRFALSSLCVYVCVCRFFNSFASARFALCSPFNHFSQVTDVYQLTRFTHSLTPHSLIHSLTPHSLIHSRTHALTLSHTLSLSLTPHSIPFSEKNLIVRVDAVRLGFTVGGVVGGMCIEREHVSNDVIMTSACHMIALLLA